MTASRRGWISFSRDTIIKEDKEMRKLRSVVSFIIVMALAISSITVLAVSASAEGIEDEVVTDEVIVPEDTTDDTVDDITDGEVNNTIFARIFEYVQEKGVTILSSTNLLAIGYYIYLYIKDKRGLANGLGKILTGQTDAKTAAIEAKDATTFTKEELVAQREKITEIANMEIERDTIVKALLYEVMTLVQLTHTVTLNNANIPQAIKDYTTSICSSCLSAINDDDKLKAAYDEMRSILGLPVSEVAANEKTGS